MGKILLGYKKFNSKSGNPCCFAYILSDATENDRKFGLIGSKPEEVFIDSSISGLLKPEFVGKEISLSYDGVNGKPIVTDILGK